MTPAPDPSDRTHATPEPRGSGPEDRYELERFKRDVDLSAFAASKGYTLDRRESSNNCRVLRHEPTNDKILVGKAVDGHWQYFSVRDRDDNGSVIDFIQRRHPKTLGEVRRELREWTHTERELPAFARKPIEPATKDRAAVALAIARSTVVEAHPYLEARRGLTRETLQHPRFQATLRASGPRRDERDLPTGTALFLHHDEHGLSGFEAKHWCFTGFAKGGTKALWWSGSTPTDRRLVITESALDAMSYHQVNAHPKTRYVSFAGGLNAQQPGLIERAISRMPSGSVIVAATDQDREGHRFADRIVAFCSHHPHVQFERHAPALGKDWNDHLRELRDRALQRNSLER